MQWTLMGEIKNWSSGSRRDEQQESGAGKKAVQGADPAAVPVLRPHAGQNGFHAKGTRLEGTRTHREEEEGGKYGWIRGAPSRHFSVAFHLPI